MNISRGNPAGHEVLVDSWPNFKAVLTRPRKEVRLPCYGVQGLSPLAGASSSVKECGAGRSQGLSLMGGACNSVAQKIADLGCEKIASPPWSFPLSKYLLAGGDG